MKVWPICLAVAAPLLAGSLGYGASLANAGQSPGRIAQAHMGDGPHASYVVVMVMENRDYELIIGSSQAPYINGSLVPEAALMTNSHAIGHPSEPNYLALFSGSTQGITDDSCPHSFGTNNVGKELLGAGLTFHAYSESMPYDGYTGCAAGKYARKHNPWVNFANVPPPSNLVYKHFVTPPSTLSFIIPNLCNDMHDCSTRAGDAWLKSNLPPIIRYGKRHDGLVILTWDEADPDANHANHIATLLIGPMIRAGKYNQKVTHYSTLRTVEDLAGIPCTAGACPAADLTGMWR